MVKKGLLVLILAVFVMGGVFAQDVHKYQPFDMLLGLNVGFGITPSITDVFNDDIPSGNYALTSDFGLTYDFYLFNVLSLNTGLLLHPDIYLILEDSISNGDKFTDLAASPICLTIPLMAHINVPAVEWLYAGVGVNLNFPLVGMFDDALEEDTKGDFFIGLPIDIGFDFIKPGRGGGRFFFRITPEFHKKGTALPIGFIWQPYNWRIHGN
ncbi:MAG: hypothetical protein LBK40_05580 [Spirochaetaceae bacterium]|jgi:hypothetical protein|nr:hypothetical protein [Spirochaetaceae bacterium]